MQTKWQTLYIHMWKTNSRRDTFAVLFAKAADTIGGGTSWEERNLTLIVHFMDDLSG